MSTTLNDADGGATRGTLSSPSRRCVLFSGPNNLGEGGGSATGGGTGGDDLLLYTVCNAGSMHCLNVNVACNITRQIAENAKSPILWSIKNAHAVGINRMIQLPRCSACRSTLVTGNNGRTVRLWDARMCGNNSGGGRNVVGGGGRRNNDNNDNDGIPFNGLMRPPNRCVQQWKVNWDYISDLILGDDGNMIFATLGDGTLSVFEVVAINDRMIQERREEATG